MKSVFILLITNTPAILLILLSGWMIFNDKPYYGWVIFAGMCCIHGFSSKNDNSRTNK